MNNSIIKIIIFNTIDEINEQLPKEKHIDTHVESPILSNLDSLAIINFIVLLEDQIYSKMQRKVDLLNINFKDISLSPIKSIGTLVSFLENYLE